MADLTEQLPLIKRAIEVALSVPEVNRRMMDLNAEVENDQTKRKVLKFLSDDFTTDLDADGILRLFRVVKKKDLTPPVPTEGCYTIYLETHQSWMVVSNGIKISQTIDMDAHREKWEANRFTDIQLMALANELVGKFGLLMNDEKWRTDLFAKSKVCFRINLTPFRQATTILNLKTAMKVHEYPPVAVKIHDPELYSVVLFFGVSNKRTRGFLFEFPKDSTSLQIQTKIMPELKIF